VSTFVAFRKTKRHTDVMGPGPRRVTPYSGTQAETC